jgi:hypothetical protein
MGAEREFEFDVAISFHSRDEGMAQQLADLIRDRFKVFLYSEQQKLLAGRDGEETFNSIFHDRARVVVVLCRKEWGETPFTRIEQTAIRNRAFEEGFDFSLFIPTDTPPTVPKWLPRTRLYFGLERFGLDGAAGVIEQLVQEQGGEPRVEDVESRAARFERAAALRHDRKQFHESEAGVMAAATAFKELSAAFQHHMERFRDAGGVLSTVQFSCELDRIILSSIYPVLVIGWKTPRYSTLKDAALHAIYYAGFPNLSGYSSPREEPSKVRQLQLTYELVRPGVSAYVMTSGEHRTFSPDALAEHLLKVFMDLAEKPPR